MEGGTGWNNEQFDACFLTSFPKAVVSNTTNPIPLVTNTDQNTPICPYPPYILFLQTPQRATSHSQAWVEQGQLYTRHPRVHPARVSAEKHLKAFKMSTGVMTRCVHCLRIAGRKQTGAVMGTRSVMFDNNTSRCRSFGFDPCFYRVECHNKIQSR